MRRRNNNKNSGYLLYFFIVVFISHCSDAGSDVPMLSSADVAAGVTQPFGLPVSNISVLGIRPYALCSFSRFAGRFRICTRSAHLSLLSLSLSARTLPLPIFAGASYPPIHTDT